MGIYQVVPIDAKPNQTFRCILEREEGTIAYHIELRYNTIGNVWCMRIADGITEECLLANIPLRTGERPSADLLSPSSYLGIGSIYVVPMVSLPSSVYPDDSNLGAEFALVWEA